MKTLIALSLLLAAAGCKKEEKVDNSATRYADSLAQSTVKAREAADKANAAIAAEAERMKEAQAQNN